MNRETADSEQHHQEFFYKNSKYIFYIDNPAPRRPDLSHRPLTTASLRPRSIDYKRNHLKNVETK